MNILNEIIKIIKDFIDNEKNKEPLQENYEIGPYVSHPLHKKRLKEYTNNIETFYRLKNRLNKDTIAFGDGLLDSSRHSFLNSINEKLNFSIKGSWANQVQQMVVDLFHLLAEKNFSIQNVIIGTLGGVQLSQNQDVNATIKISYDCLDKIRSVFPLSKIIVTGLPEIYGPSTTKNSLKFEGKIYEWVHRDKNAVFIPMFKKFKKELFNVTTNNDEDEATLTREAEIILDNLFVQAKSAKPKSIIG